MTLRISLNGEKRTIPAVPLTPAAFAPYGLVVENPLPGIHPATEPVPKQAKDHVIRSEQVTAFKYVHMGYPLNLYPQAPSGTPGSTSLSLFVVTATETRKPDAPGIYDVKLLERHPFTTQTFAPMITPAGCSYLVLVAPSLPPGEEGSDLAFPSDVGPDNQGRGMPDLTKIQAFVATGRQVVTYGAGTWHAPMVVLGREGEAMEFTVSQFSNGVVDEDIQMVSFGGENQDGQGWVNVEIPDERETSLR